MEKCIFSVSLYGELEKLTETISKGRCRTFYKKGNRNGSYITDEFADKLLSTIPYAPVKGIYDEVDGDYTDHGEERTLGRIYGIVPSEPNLAWEDHEDKDGVTRTYACVDVYLYTGLYPEAGEIFSKSQSMELYPPSIKGHEEIIDGQNYFVFEEGCFLGLQVLGDDTEPCFEGAAFFSLCESVKELTEKIKELELAQKISKGGSVMVLNYQLSDREKHDQIWSLLNTNYNEENGYAIDYEVSEIFDDYAIVFKYADKKFFKVNYTKEGDTVSLGEHEEVFGVFVNQEEKDALDALRVENATLQEEKEQFEQTIEEKDTKIASLEEEKATVESNLEEANNSLNELRDEVSSLNEYKLEVETKAKKEVFAKYATKLSEETINSYRDKMDTFSVKELDKELAYELVNADESIFSADPQGQFPKEEPTTGLEAFLSQFEKK